jgi:hypothetical protein
MDFNEPAVGLKHRAIPRQMNRTDVAGELESLRYRVESLEAERRVTRRRLRAGAVVVAFAAAFSAGVVGAATGNCPNALPVCFTADTPAYASDVNLNFAQLHEWVTQKVGAVGTADVTHTTTESFSGANRQMLFFGNTTNGVGVQTGAVYSRTTDGFAWFKNGSHNDARFNNGGGSTLATLDSTGLAVPTTVSANSVVGNGVSSNGNIYAAGDISAGGNSTPVTGFGNIQAPTRNDAVDGIDRNYCSPSGGRSVSETNCPNGTFACGLLWSHNCGQNWFEAKLQLKCCSL